MRQKSMTPTSPSERLVKNIRRVTRKHYSAEEKIRIVLDGLRGERVLVADWRCDWVGMGLAEKLAREGRHVRLAITGTHVGQNLQQYLRDHWAGKLHKLGAEGIPYARLFGVDTDTAYMAHIVSGDAIIVSEVETVVLALGHWPNTSLEEELAPLRVPLHLAGGCLAPRSAEEAVYQGMMAGLAV